MRFVLALLLCLPAMALDNSITVHEASGSTQTNRPMTVFRAFAQGEFASGYYPKPRIDSVAADAWQVDVWNTWPDGSVMFAHISLRLSLTANGSAVVDFVSSSDACHLGSVATCQAAALTQTQMLDYDTGGGTGSWSATWYGTVNSITYSAAARTMMNVGAWRWMLRGPVVSAVIVEDRSTALAYDFGWQYVTDHWEAPGSNNYKSLHPSYELRFYPGDGDGPLPDGWAGVEVDGILLNGSTTRLQRINTLDLSLKTGNAEADTAYSVTGKAFHARSARHYRTWSGTAPGAVVVDYNLPYLIHSKILPSYDKDFSYSEAIANTTITNYETNLGSDDAQWCSNANYCANWLKYVGTQGARGDIALVAYWYVHYLYLMGSETSTTAKKLEIWNKLVLGNADAGGTLPAHYMETATGKTFFSTYDSTDAFGRFGSINARPGWIAGGTGESSSGLSSERVTPVCSSIPCDGRGASGIANGSTGGWTAYSQTNYNSHAPSIFGLPAMLTGYHYYIAGAQAEAAYALATTQACAVGSACRQYQHGIIYFNNPLRGTTWSLRQLMLAYMVTPDGQAIERAYFADKLKKNARFMEGVYFMTSGAHPPSDATCTGFTISDGNSRGASFDLWCAGRAYWSSTLGGPGIPAGNPLYIPDYGSTQSLSTDGWTAGGRRTTRYWTFYLASVLGWMVQSGALLDDDSLPVTYHFRRGLAHHMAGRVLYSTTSLNLLRDIEGPVGYDGSIAQTWADHIATYVTAHTLGADMTAGQTTVVITDKDTGASNRGESWLNRSWLKVGSEYFQLSGGYTLDSPTSGYSTLTISNRGSWGSTGTTHSTSDAATWIPGPWVTYSSNNDGYPIVARAALAMGYDALQIGDYNPKTAYQTFRASLPVQTPSSPYWFFRPRDAIENVTATGGSGTASLSWLAPSGAACIVYLGTTAPASSQDGDGETVNTSLGRRQSVAATGLSAGVKHWRITCGTARTSGTVEVN